MARGRPFGAALALALWPAWARACESCSDALAQDPGAHGFARGIYYSILFLFAVLGTLVAVIVRAIVKEARRDGSGSSGEPS